VAKQKRSQRIMLDHSKAKIELLKKYLEKYLNIIANDGFTKKIDIYDLFCGEGIYENKGEGSPIIILKVLNELHQINKGKIRNIPKINLWFNDNKDEKIEKLKKIILDNNLHNNTYGELHFRNKDYKEIVNSLAKYISSDKTKKAFIFIDPYGYKEIRASEIKNLLISKKSEVLLFLPTQFMYRFDEKGTPQALIDILEELVDLKQWKVSSSVYEFIDQFKEALKKYLGTEFFVDTFSIEKDEATVFCLFFFSGHIRGFEKMLETNPLEEKLLLLLTEKKQISNGEIYEFTLRCGFLPKHTVEIFNSLQLEERLEVSSLKEEKVRKGAFYINYDNFKVAPQKVYFKLI
jgi:three-Cys-motif partner protein